MTDVTGALDGSVELLDRALAYTRVQLADVRGDLLGRPTPCSAWTLADLLAHMEDALDAFTEAAGGTVAVVGAARRAPAAPIPGPGGRLVAIQRKACALLAAWSAPEPAGLVRVGGAPLASPVLVSTAAMEITVHGWDVAQSTGARTRIPVGLATDLLPVAQRVVDTADRGVRFGAPRPVPAEAPADLRLLAELGRAPATG